MPKKFKTQKDLDECLLRIERKKTTSLDEIKNILIQMSDMNRISRKREEWIDRQELFNEIIDYLTELIDDEKKRKIEQTIKSNCKIMQYGDFDWVIQDVLKIIG